MKPVQKRGSDTRTLRQHVLEDIRAHIRNQTFAPGERLPSISALCRKYGVSDITIRAALRELMHAGYLESQWRSGVFVKAQREEKPNLAGERVIALLVPALNNPFFGDIIHEAEEQCRLADYRVIIANSTDDAALEAQQIKKLAQQVAGLIVMPSRGRNYVAYAELMEKNVPFVFLDRYVEKLAVPFVGTDNEQGGYLATRHLLQTGRRRVFVLVEPDGTSYEERLCGYRRALKEEGVAFDPTLVLRSPLFNDACGYMLTKELLLRSRDEGREEEPIGIFALNDCIARGSYMALKEAGKNIPNDVAVVGFDDISAVFLDPPLSSVRQDVRELGTTAVRLLLETILSGGRHPAPTVRLQPELMIRQSSDAASAFSLIEHFVGNAP